MDEKQCKIIFLVLLFLSMVLFGACSGDEVNKSDIITEEKLEIEESQISIDGKGGTFYIQGSSNTAWSAKSDNSWLGIKPERGEAGRFTITVNVLANDDLSVRRGSIKVKAGKLEKTVGIVQNGMTPSPGVVLDVSLDDESEFGNEAQNIDIFINSSSEWTAETESSWLTVTPGSGDAGTWDLVLSMLENRSAFARENTLVVKAKDIKNSKTIRQLGVAETLVTVGKTDFDSNGGITDVCVNTIDELDYNIPSECKWVSLYSANDGVMKFLISANRSALARSTTFKAGTICRLIDIEIRQNGIPETNIEISQTVFTSEGGEFYVQVNTCDALKYELPAACHWISLLNNNVDTATMSFKVDRNLSPDSREATVKVGTVQKTIEIIISQNGMSGGSGDIEDMPAIPLSL